MARKKTLVLEGQVNEYRKVLPSGKIKLFYPEGVIDIRAKKLYSEAVIEPKNEEKFVRATEENKEKYLINLE